MSRKSFEHNRDQVLSEWHFRKNKISVTATEFILIQLFSYTVVSKQKIKMKTRNTMTPSYHSKVTSTQNNGDPFYSCLPHGLAGQSWSTFNVCTKTVNEFYVFLTGLNSWAFVYKLSSCGIDSCCSYLDFRHCACFEQGALWHLSNCRVYIHSKTRMWHDKNTQLKSFLLLRSVLLNYFICRVKAS